MKLNMDGMAQGAPGRVIVGLQRSLGVVIGAYCFDVGIGTAYLAEILALIQGIEYAYHRSWHRLWIELDFMAVLHCLESSFYLPP